MSCENLILPKGADHTRTIWLYDQYGNLITTGGAFTKMVITVKHANGTVLAKFSKNAATGYQLIDMTDISLGKVYIKLLSSHTTGKPSGKVFYDVHAQMPDGSITDDGVLDLINADLYLCTLIDSATGGTVLP